MTAEEYIEEHKCKPLTPVELNSKDKVKIFGTDDLMPWDEVYARIAAGMDMGHIAQIYGNGRKIALWAVHDNIELLEPISDLLDSEIEQRRKMAALDEQNPVVALTIHEMANEYAPDVSKSVALFAKELVEKARTVVGRVEANSTDLLNCAKAVQTTTDVLGLTQRHAAAGHQTTNHVAVSGFTFVEYVPDDQMEAIEAEVM